jgi:hypothetical protein
MPPLDIALFAVGPTVVSALDAWLTHPQKCKDIETRCRKCDYILRGLTEPRCPECGERI